MELPLTELAKSLDMAPGTIERWIRQGRIPVKRRGDTCVFNLQAVKKWAAELNMTFKPPGDAPAGKTEEPLETLQSAIRRGGIHYDLPGNSVEEVLRAAVGQMAAVNGPDRELLYENLISRERMMSTGIGNGVAIPHPRTPLVGGDMPEQIAAFFLADPIDYQAVDKKPVFVLFVLVAPTAKRHLRLLSRLSFCLRDPGFSQLLARTPAPDTLMETIAGFDRRLDAPGR